MMIPMNAIIPKKIPTTGPAYEQQYSLP
jgi:hypothetical protein